MYDAIKILKTKLEVAWDGNNVVKKQNSLSHFE